MRTKPMSGDYSVGVQALQDSGYKLTGPRLTILQLLEESGGPNYSPLLPPPPFSLEPPLLCGRGFPSPLPPVKHTSFFLKYAGGVGIPLLRPCPGLTR